MNATLIGLAAAAAYLALKPKGSAAKKPKKLTPDKKIPKVSWRPNGNTSISTNDSELPAVDVMFPGGMLAEVGIFEGSDGFVEVVERTPTRVRIALVQPLQPGQTAEAIVMRIPSGQPGQPSDAEHVFEFTGSEES